MSACQIDRTCSNNMNCQYNISVDASILPKGWSVPQQKPKSQASDGTPVRIEVREEINTLGGHGAGQITSRVVGLLGRGCG